MRRYTFAMTNPKNDPQFTLHVHAMRKLTRLSYAVEGLEKTVNWRMPLHFSLIMTVVLAIDVAMINWILG